MTKLTLNKCDQCQCFENCVYIGCAFPLTATFNNPPKPIADVSTKGIEIADICDQCVLTNGGVCFYRGHLNRGTLCFLNRRKPLTDRDLVAKIEGAKVLRAEDLNELVKRFKEYAKLT